MEKTNKTKSKSRLKKGKFFKFLKWFGVVLGLIIILIVGYFTVQAYRINSTEPLTDIVKAEIKTYDKETADVALIQSSKEYAEDITEDDIRTMITEAVELAGGLDNIIEDGDFVVLKPNLISAYHRVNGMASTEENMLDQEVNGIATDYRVIKVASELVRELNPNGKIYVMETSGWDNTEENMEILGWTKENLPEVNEILTFDESGDSLYSVDTSDLTAVDIGDKKLYTDDVDKWTEGNYYIDRTYYSADVVIDLPLVKSHGNAAITGGVKNVAIGTAPPSVYGNSFMASTIMPLTRLGVDHSWEPLNKFIHDFYLVKPVDFVITDGLQGMEYGPIGQGAETYESAKKNMRIVLASQNAVAIDTIHSYIIGVDPEQVDYLKYLAADNMGIMDPARINVLGNVRVSDVKKPFASQADDIRKYDDFENPELNLSDAILKDNILEGTLISNKDLIKVAVYIDGKLADSIVANEKEIKFSFEEIEYSADSSVEVYGFDKFLNSSKVEIQ